jgi:hypothetical protein
MRTSLLFVALLSAAAACETTPRVSVIRNAPLPSQKGDPVKIRRGAQEAFAGVGGGFYVVRTREDWRALWPDGKDPALPPTLDTSRSMLLLAVGDTHETTGITVKKAVDVGEYLDVLVHETKPGEGCLVKLDRPAFDAVVVDRIDKPVKFYVEEERGEGCGSPPAVDVKCRVGDAPQWASAIQAKPGDTIDCNMTATSSGRFEITDRALRFHDVPAGSSAKLAYTKGATRATFAVDVFGKYAVSGEATDESGRKSVGAAQVDAAPPKTKDVLVELVWSNFEAMDEPETFPRVKLRASEEAERPKRRGAAAPRECDVDAPIAGVCEVKTRRTAYSEMKLFADPKPKKMPLSVVYTDERIEQGPMVCLQVYFDGARTFETCDRQHRAAGDTWQAGTVDLATGKIAPAATSAADATSDAGAPPHGGAGPAAPASAAPAPAAPPKK